MHHLESTRNSWLGREKRNVVGARNSTCDAKPLDPAWTGAVPESSWGSGPIRVWRGHGPALVHGASGCLTV